MTLCERIDAIDATTTISLSAPKIISADVRNAYHAESESGTIRAPQLTVLHKNTVNWPPFNSDSILFDVSTPVCTSAHAINAQDRKKKRKKKIIQ